MEYIDITCPVCGLACDDLAVNIGKSGVEEIGSACPMGERYLLEAWSTETSAAAPRIRNRAVSLEEAIDHASGLLSVAGAPLISGLSMDTGGARAALALADRCGGVIEHRESAAQQRNIRILQDTGWFTTTLTEVRNRADLLVIVGATVFDAFPRLLERAAPREGLFLTSERSLVLIGPWNGAELPEAIRNADVKIIDLPLERCGEAAGLLRAAVAGHPLDRTNTSGLPVKALVKLAEQLQSAAYSVVAWAANDLDFPHATLAIESWTELVKDLNQTTRSAGLPLGGGNGTLSVNQVCVWQCGFPLRTSFATGRPEHDAWRYDSRRLLANGEIDLLVWIADLLPDTPPAPNTPQIVIGHPAMRFSDPPEVYIPVGIPGIDHAGHSFRMDAVVSLPLRKLRAARWPSAAETMNKLVNNLRSGQASQCYSS